MVNQKISYNHNSPLLRQSKELDCQDYWLVWIEKNQSHFKPGQDGKLLYIPVIGHLHSKMTLDVATLISTSCVNKKITKQILLTGRLKHTRSAIYYVQVEALHNITFLLFLRGWRMGGGVSRGVRWTWCVFAIEGFNLETVNFEQILPGPPPLYETLIYSTSSNS